MSRLPSARVLLQSAVLLATAAAVVASQGPLDAWTETDEVPVETFVLTATDTGWIGTLVLTSLPADAPVGQSLTASVEVSATAFWTPPADTFAPDRPEFTVTVAPEGLSPRGDEVDSTVLFERERTTLTVASTALEGCTDADTCTERFTVEVTRGGPPSGGEVEVEVGATTLVFGSTGSAPPPGLAVQLSLE